MVGEICEEPQTLNQPPKALADDSINLFVRIIDMLVSLQWAGRQYCQ